MTITLNDGSGRTYATWADALANIGPSSVAIVQAREAAAANAAPVNMGPGTGGASVAAQIMADNHKAVSFASAFGEMKEGLRPNCWVALLTATPAVAIGTGAATGILTVSLPSETEIVVMAATTGDALDFLVTDLQFNSWQMNKGGAGANLEMLTAPTERTDRPVPLVGRTWDGTIVIQGNFLNTNSGSKIFHGLTFWGYNGDCPPLKGTKSAQGFGEWTEVVRATRAMVAGMGGNMATAVA